jgi:AcrR family transcriptional regulator
MPEPTPVQQARRDTGPATNRGATRKRNLLEAARRVFESRGFIDTRVRDIVKEAQVSHGTFYTYFDTKEAVFDAVARDVIERMVESMSGAVPSVTLDDRAHEAIRRFIHAYLPNTTMIGLIEQVGTFSPEMRQLRLDVRDTFVRRTKRSLQRQKDEGAIDADVDVEYTAEVLGAMLEYTCHVWLNLGKDFEEDRLVDALARVWVNSIRTPQ